MQIIVPMSGFGERFRRAGYDVPKALIPVEGRPIIAHVAGLFPGEDDFLFICNQDHLDTPRYRMREQLRAIRPGGKVEGIAPHKLGPVNAVLQARAHVKLDEPVIVNYCDFACTWDYSRFKALVLESRCDGAIAC
ncbi:MAG: NTP transferase domain-containing protein, partial [Candidatus Lambdaproteobacteria bacterium]|nr:NTP transferase domain-containing protein [Candidatus Lambdaproteobacteria bacterium]